ncbi:MAG TPA: hypothetical protein VFJ19_18645 [Nocardioidaceae bacterium]|nr:hypothetical protein [Nocardioidaceae bacterium]
MPAPSTIAVRFNTVSDGWLAAAVHGSIELFRTSDEGRHWALEGQHSLRDPQMQVTPPAGALSVATDGNHVLVLNSEPSSSNFSFGRSFSTPDGGRSWSVARAPSGGSVNFADGVFWLVGGPLHNKLFKSQTGITWSEVHVSVADETSTFADPVQTDIGLVLPVTIHKSDDTSVLALYVSRDNGATWSVNSKVPVHAATALGASLALSVQDAGTWQTVATEGSKLYSGSLHQPAKVSIVSPNGLPAQVVGLRFTSADRGVALVDIGSCPSGKASCHDTEELVGTTDGGQTWTPIDE